jgi:hypothetical protein
MPLVMNKGEQMNAKKNNVREHPAMMEQLEDRQLYSASMMTPSIPIPPPGPSSSSRLVVVSPTIAPVQTNLVVIAIIAVLIG